jgi:hypothetical protein
MMTRAIVVITSCHTHALGRSSANKGSCFESCTFNVDNAFQECRLTARRRGPAAMMTRDEAKLLRAS